MERFDVEQSRTLAAIVDAAERGEPAEIVRHGRVVAEVRSVPPAEAEGPDQEQKRVLSKEEFWEDFWRKLHALQEMIPPAARGGDGLVEQMREEGY